MAHIIAITSGKGGVGKSTFTVGLGYALAKRNRKVLLVDCDAGLRCLDHILGISDQLLFDMEDILKEICSPEEAVYTSAWHPQLFLLPSAHTYRRDVNTDMVQQLFSYFGKYYDYILLDTPAGLGLGAQTAISLAQFVYIIVTPDPVCVRDANAVREKAEEFSIASRLVINRFEYRLFQKARYYRNLDEVIDACGIQLLGLLPEDSEVALSCASGRPFPPASAIGKAFFRVAARMEGEPTPIHLDKF